MKSGTLPSSWKNLAKTEQGNARSGTTTKTNYSASVELSHETRKKVLAVKKILSGSKQLKMVVDFVY
jgi:hypothetical protein